jgi:hypothetical protein
MTNSNHPVADEATEALAASRARAAETMRELTARVEERKRERALKLSAPAVEKPAVEWIPRERPEPVSVELLELEAQIQCYERKLKRTKRPLGWARRQAMKQRVAEMKSLRKELKKR